MEGACVANSNIPDRFLGFAFTVGDILLEIDTKHKILNADGAISALGLEKGQSLAGAALKDIMSPDDYSLFETFIDGLEKASRIGPFTLSVGIDEEKRKPFTFFCGKLPMLKGKIFLALAYPYRLGISDAEEESLTDDEKKGRFFNKLDSLLHQSADAEEKLMVTVMEIFQESELTQGKQQDVEKFLKTFSVGGNSASKLSENKFALVHEKGEKGDAGKSIAKNIAKSTGVELSSASIDAGDITDEGGDDNIKALVFSLQQFADDAEDFSLTNFQEEGKSLITANSQKINTFRTMLNKGDFKFVYQPIVSLRSGTTHHFEALSRFNMPGMNDNQFEMICFAEDVGMIMDFDQAVLTRAIEMLKPKLGVGSAPKIAVNISGRSLSNARFIEDMIKILQKTPSLSRNISLEITESSKIHDLELLNKVLNEVRNIGYRVYLDDFGAGASGFQYLKQLTVDGVKIDGEYVRDAAKDKTTRAFLLSMATLCQNIGVETVAEWVETKEQMDLLAKIGISYGQGYYFGKPSESLTPTRAR